MMKRLTIVIFSFTLLLIGCATDEANIEQEEVITKTEGYESASEQTEAPEVQANDDFSEESKKDEKDVAEQTAEHDQANEETLDFSLFEQTPKEWGENVTG